MRKLIAVLAMGLFLISCTTVDSSKVYSNQKKLRTSAEGADRAPSNFR